MLIRYLAIVMLAVWAGTAPAQNNPQAGIEETINGQIEAFKVDDFTSAFEFASPAIQQIFGSAGRFGEMVQQGFPMVQAPAQLRFFELKQRPGRMLQTVMIQDQQGVFHMLEYEMIMAGGSWQINGVRLLAQPEVGA